jgi:hypothetical protein
MRVRFAVAVAALVAAISGCSSPTRLSLALTIADGAAPDALSLSVYDPHAALVRNHSLLHPSLPGTVMLYDVQPATLRIAIDADDGREAWAQVTVDSGTTAHGSLALSSAVTDGDRDGVPDAVDNCPTVANPDQASSDGVRGDACANGGRDLGAVVMSTPHDLAGDDFAHVDRDLAAPSDAFTSNGLCPLAGALLCEDWTTPYPNGAWSPETSNAPPQITIANDTTQTFHSSNALHIHVAPFTNTTSYVQADVATNDLPAGSYWMRVYVYLPSASAPKEVTLLSLYHDGGPDYASWMIGIDEGGRVAFADDISASHVEATSATTFPTDRWVCVEWQAVQVATAGQSSSHFYLDGSELTDLAVTNASAHPADDNRFVVATEFSGGMNFPNGMDAWFDQIVYSATRPGCFH